MALATDAGKQTGTPLPMGEAAEEFYADTIEKEPELARRDFSVVYEYLRGLQKQ